MLHLCTRSFHSSTSSGEALNHPFITGAAFFPRYASMQPADFDAPPLPSEEDTLVSRSAEKFGTIVER